MSARIEVVAEARRWIGTRWMHLGRVHGVGVDCIGLVHEVAKAMGYAKDVVIPPYARTPSNNTMMNLCEQHLVRIATPEIGSVALMSFQTEPHHMGILGDYPHGGFSLIHSYAKMRKVVEHRLDDVWQSRIVAYYDFPGINW